MLDCKEKQPTNYNWLYERDGNSYITVDEIASIYSIKPISIHARVRNGRFPTAANKQATGHRPSINYWSVSTVLAQVHHDITRFNQSKR